MKRILSPALFFFLFAGSQRGRELFKPVQQSQEIETVSFCDLLRDPGAFDGKTIKVTAIYSHGFHEGVFYDNDCSTSQPSAEHTALAKFSGKTPESARASEKIGQALKKYKTSELKVTMIAIFRDPQIVGDVPRSCCWFELGIRQILSIERVNPPMN